MPILMIALFALAVFGVIGILLTAAVILETKKANATKPPNTPANKRAASPLPETPLDRTWNRPCPSCAYPPEPSAKCPTKLFPLCSDPNTTTVASSAMFAISNAASAHAYPSQSRSAYSMLLVAAANKIPS